MEDVIEVERGGEADEQEQWNPLGALIWPCCSSSFLTHKHTHTHTHTNTLLWQLYIFCAQKND